MRAYLQRFRLRMKDCLEAAFPTLRPLATAKAKETVERKFQTHGTPPASQDLRVLVRRVTGLWSSAAPDGLGTMNRKELRAVPWILSQKSPLGVGEDADLVRALLRVLEPRWKKALSRLIYSYLLYYDPSLPGTDAVREFINVKLGEITTDPPLRLSTWVKRAFPLFARDGPRHAALMLLAQEKDFCEFLSDDLGLKGTLSSGEFVHRTCLALVEAVNPASDSHLDRTISLLETYSKSFSDLCPYAADKIIPKVGSNAPAEIQDLLRSFFLRTMGDPRISGGAGKWSSVGQEAKEIFIEWISRQDLEFFFDIVSRTCKYDKWVERLSFWRSYIPYMENTWVALGSRARELVSDPRMKQHMEDRSFGVLRGAESTQSIFLVQMRGYIFLEWSHSGGCRVYKLKDVVDHDLPMALGRKLYSASLVRDDVYLIEKWNHIPNWQYNLSRWIMINLGIRPRPR
ncbi:MAG TPA: hypothetical protein GXX30_03065 [Firmicutes bacterium]|nr:hypothetical protein [Candidatus Fermentithermobacillaceae bacterium]